MATFKTDVSSPCNMLIFSLKLYMPRHGACKIQILTAVENLHAMEVHMVKASGSLESKRSSLVLGFRVSYVCVFPLISSLRGLIKHSTEADDQTLLGLSVGRELIKAVEVISCDNPRIQGISDVNLIK
jgi:hypothetical protein